MARIATKSWALRQVALCQGSYNSVELGAFLIDLPRPVPMRLHS
jgi:hypothetical protein